MRIYNLFAELYDGESEISKFAAMLKMSQANSLLGSQKSSTFSTENQTPRFSKTFKSRNWEILADETPLNHHDQTDPSTPTIVPPSAKKFLENYHKKNMKYSGSSGSESEDISDILRNILQQAGARECHQPVDAFEYYQHKLDHDQFRENQDILASTANHTPIKSFKPSALRSDVPSSPFSPFHDPELNDQQLFEMISQFDNIQKKPSAEELKKSSSSLGGHTKVISHNANDNPGSSHFSAGGCTTAIDDDFDDLFEPELENILSQMEIPNNGDLLSQNAKNNMKYELTSRNDPSSTSLSSCGSSVLLRNNQDNNMASHPSNGSQMIMTDVASSFTNGSLSSTSDASNVKSSSSANQNKQTLSSSSFPLKNRSSGWSSLNALNSIRGGSKRSTVTAHKK